VRNGTRSDGRQVKLHNEFTVAAPLEETWRTLLDIERVATCLPGAAVEPGSDEGVYRGRMKMRIGPMTVDYRGTARLEEIDEDTRTASIVVQAREEKGQGTAAAVIRNRVSSENGSTHVSAETELKLTGRQAQFGRGVVEDVAAAMMQEFATRLEREITAGGGEGQPVAATADAAQATGDEEEEEALDLGGVLLHSPQVRRLAIVAGAVLAALVVVLIARRPGRRVTFNIDLRR
jgi:carbon monoxide dehydrogenase subunit G